MGRLRRGAVLRALSRVLGVLLGRPDFRIVHISIQHNHLHCIIEASSKAALSAGMHDFTILAAKAINAVQGRTGKVFRYRYHATQIRSPKQARHTLAYVLNNWRRHLEDHGSARAGVAKIDPYSSAIAFTGWREVPRFEVPVGYEPLPVSPAQSWLMRIGWKSRGPISVYERPVWGALPS